jgi:4-amino-4-deoxy-L-arabinose transferase-like glycosyltransferase
MSCLGDLLKLRFDRRTLLWALFITALLVRLAYISTLKEGYYFSDFRVYEKAALSLINGDGFDTDYRRPPLYPLFLAANYLVLGKHFFTVRLIQALLGAYCCVLIYLIGSRLVGDRAGKIAGVISVFYPYYVFIAGLLYPTLITTFLMINVLFFAILAREQKSIAYFLLAVFCLGIATMATPVSLAFLPFLILAMPRELAVKPGRRWLIYAASILITAACILPWTAYYYRAHGKLILVDARVEAHLPNLAGNVGTDDHQNPPRGRFQSMLDNPGKTIVRVGSEFLHFWALVPDRVVTRDSEYRQRRHQEDTRLVVNHAFTSSLLNYVSILTFGPVLILAIWGIVVFRKRKQVIILPLLMLLSQAVGYSFFFTQVRYRLPVEFCLMILAGAGAVAIYDRYRARPVTSGG